MSVLVTERAPERLPVPRRRRSPRTLAIGGAVVAVLVALHVAAWIGTGMDPGMLVDGWHGMVRFVSEAVPPDLAWDPVVKDGLHACLVTLWIGLLGTTLSIPFTIVLCALGSRAVNGNGAADILFYPHVTPCRCPTPGAAGTIDTLWRRAGSEATGFTATLWTMEEIAGKNRSETTSARQAEA